jgi:radical SAM superfamily enzyme YgiQ (UPF0313 family)
MHVTFVHTPMPTVAVEQRRGFWRHFDRRYHAVHPGLKHMEHNLWELPHWMTWLGGVLEQAGFRSLAAVDPYAISCDSRGIEETTALAALRRYPSDIYLFSPTTVNVRCALRIAECAKSLYPACITVFGGVAATPLDKDLAQERSVDFVVRGRGERALPGLLRALRQREPISSVGNLTYKTPDGAVARSKFVYPDMVAKEIPPPKLDLLPGTLGKDIRYLRHVYALGCPYKCAFCTIQTNGQRPSYFPVQRVLAEIQAYRSVYGEHHNVYFGDETFTLSARRTVDLCKALAQAGDVLYDCQTRLNCLSHFGLFQHLHRSGCRWLEIGIESLDQRAQDAFKQGVSLVNLRRTLAELRDAGIPVCSFLLNGLPNQTVADMQRAIEEACSLITTGLLHASYLFGFVPYPGSRAYESPERFGITLRHSDFTRYHEDLEPVFDSHFAQASEVYRVFLDGLESLSDAMSGRPYLGDMPLDNNKDAYGTFWCGTHI